MNAVNSCESDVKAVGLSRKTVKKERVQEALELSLGVILWTKMTGVLAR